MRPRESLRVLFGHIKDVMILKIERISDTQVKFILDNADLLEKNLKITELAYGSEKTQVLFQEMLERAYNECGFEVENVPIMIEAIPVAVDSIIIIVTKVANGGDIEAKFNNFFSKTGDFSQSHRKDVGFGKSFGAVPPSNRQMPNPFPSPQAHQKPMPRPRSQRERVYVYSFAKMDDAISLCARIADIYDGQSSMYKHSGKYFMVFDNRQSIKRVRELQNILSEYATKHVSGEITKFYLMEHGETMIATDAVQLLAKI